MKQAKSKQKILDKMEADGLTPPVVHHRPFSFSFPDCEKLPPPVLPFVNVSFAYSGKEEDMLYRVRPLCLGVAYAGKIVQPIWTEKCPWSLCMYSRPDCTDFWVSSRVPIFHG